MAVVYLAQIIGGLLLLAGRFVPLGLAILAPVLVNILNYHITMDPGGIGLGLIATILWVIVCLPYGPASPQSFSSARRKRQLQRREIQDRASSRRRWL
jgi:hypothetical protein